LAEKLFRLLAEAFCRLLAETLVKKSFPAVVFFLQIELPLRGCKQRFFILTDDKAICMATTASKNSAVQFGL
jgi:uncharacterized protein (DUF608 family)